MAENDPQHRSDLAAVDVDDLLVAIDTRRDEAALDEVRRRAKLGDEDAAAQLETRGLLAGGFKQRDELEVGLFSPHLAKALEGIRLLGKIVPEADPDSSVEAMRDELARELAYAINGAGEYAALEVIDLARAIRDLSEAYTRLGGELRIAGVERPRISLGEVAVVERTVAAAWRAANDAGATTAVADAVAAAVRDELDQARRG